jgi:H+/gluconate symporter-like permease
VNLALIRGRENTPLKAMEVIISMFPALIAIVALFVTQDFGGKQVITDSITPAFAVVALVLMVIAAILAYNKIINKEDEHYLSQFR